MAKHYGNFEVAGKLWVGLDSETYSYNFPLSTETRSEGDILVLVDQSGKLNFEFTKLDASNVTYSPSASSEWTSVPSNVSEALDILNSKPVVTSFLTLTDTPTNYTGSDGYIVTVNEGTGELEFSDPSDFGDILAGVEDCDLVNQVYTITHSTIDTNTAIHNISLVVPSSGAALYVEGITNITTTSFDVVLSGVPEALGYKINWGIFNPGSAFVTSSAFSISGIEISTIDASGGVDNVVSNVSAIRFDEDSGFGVQDLGGNAVKVLMNSTFKTWKVDGQSDLVADGLDTIEFVAGDNISITTDPLSSPKSITINSTATATSGMAAQSGVEDVVVGQSVYEITHSSTSDYPVASIVVPTSADFISILGIFDKTDTSFKVVLSSSPAVTGYKISWYVTNSNGSGQGLSSRSTLQGTTSTISDSASASLDIAGYKGYGLYQIETSVAARVRVYANDASRLADASRAEGTDPADNSGLISEVVTTSGSLDKLVSPGTIGFNAESPVTTNIPILVTNKSGGNAAITVTLTAIKLEV